MDFANNPGLEDPTLIGLPKLDKHEAPECHMAGSPCTREGTEGVRQFFRPGPANNSCW